MIVPSTSRRGRRVLAEFARNDPRSVDPDKPTYMGLVGDALALVAPVKGVPGAHRWMLDEEEWGLIRETATGEFHLISGEGGSVNFDKYRSEGEPIAHSHPWSGRALTQSMTIDKMIGIAHDRLLVLPTVSDFVYPARRSQRTHTVYTPYALDAQLTLRNPNDPAAKGSSRLVWQLTEIQLDDEPNNQMTGRLAATTIARPNDEVWVRKVKARATDEDLKGTDYEFAVQKDT